MVDLVADQVAKGRTVSFAPVPSLPEFVAIEITDPALGESVTEASCRPDQVDVHAVLRRVVQELNAKESQG